MQPAPETPPLLVRPGVVGWYLAYAGFMALLYLGCAVLFGVFAEAMVASEDIADPAAAAAAASVIRVIMLLVCGPLFLLFAAAFFLPPRPWVWIYHLVLIALGLTSPCLLPVCIPLLVFWLKPETKAWFGRR